MIVRRLAPLMFACLVLACLALGCTPAAAPPPSTPPPIPRPAPAQDPVERGEYLVTIMACEDCHTPGGPFGAEDRSRRLGGSDHGWGGPWGVSYSDNLTPDMETGLGKWTEEDFVKALRTGMRPDGTMILPPMPWPRHAHMTEADLHAVWAFLRSLPPVSHEVPKELPPGTTPEGGASTSPAPSAWDVPPPPAG